MAVLALDIGTSSARAVVFDHSGRRLGPEGQTRYQVQTTAAGGAQLSASRIRDGLFAAIDQALKGVDATIEAVGISCFWHSFLALSSGGTPRSAVYTWEDRTFVAALPALAAALDADAYRQRTGCHLHPSYPPAKVAGFVAAGQRVEMVGSFSAYLVGQLFGRVEEGISMASASGFFDRTRRQWDTRTLVAVGVPAAAMPTIGEGWVGQRLRPALARRWPKLKAAKWLFPIGDGAAASLSSAGRSDTAVLSLGTSGGLRRLTDQPPAQIPQPLFCYLLDSERSVLGGALSGGGNVLAWLHQVAQLADWTEVAGLLNRRPVGQGGVLAWPHLAGMRSPNWEWDASGVLVGLSLATKPADLMAAMVEAICCDFGTIFQALRSVLPANRVEASGGGLLAVRQWPQWLADALEVPVSVPKEAEGSAWGAAKMAFSALGQGARLSVGPSRRYTPKPQGQARFERLQATRLEVSGHLSAIWDVLAKERLT
ncbi:MAG: FGGY-family carbohydrate kinase [Sulfobacillus sp.]